MKCRFTRKANLLPLSLLLAALTLTACAGGKGRKPPPQPQSPGTLGRFETVGEYRLSAGDTVELIYEMSAEAVAEYRLAPNDLVDVRFPSLPELGGVQRVRPDGRLSLPYVGDLAVAGLTTGECVAAMREALAGVLREPDVYVVLQEAVRGAYAMRELLRAQGGARLATLGPDGTLSLPLVGTVEAAGLTVEALTQRLAARYEEQAVGLRPQVLLHQAAGGRIFLLGEVHHPGAYAFEGKPGVVELLALGGGATYNAVLENVVIIRRSEGQLHYLLVNVGEIFSQESLGVPPAVHPGDIVFVPRQRLASLAHVSTLIQDALMFRGFSTSVSGSYRLDGKNN